MPKLLDWTILLLIVGGSFNLVCWPFGLIVKLVSELVMDTVLLTTLELALWFAGAAVAVAVGLFAAAWEEIRDRSLTPDMH